MAQKLNDNCLNLKNGTTMRIKIMLFILLPLLSLNVSLGQQSQNKIRISGQVTDDKGSPVSGVFIFVDNKNTNVITDNKGLYRLKVKPDADSMSIFLYDNLICETAIDGRNIINFTLNRHMSALKDYEENRKSSKSVNIGYGNIDKNDLTNQVNKVDGKDNRYDSYDSIYEMLRGTPGVQVIPGDGINGGDRVLIQGQSSTTRPSYPLFVVDGIPRESINDIMPSMVESISVLKGSSSAIYGSQGAFGVILIDLIRMP